MLNHYCQQYVTHDPSVFWKTWNSSGVGRILVDRSCLLKEIKSATIQTYPRPKHIGLENYRIKLEMFKRTIHTHTQTHILWIQIHLYFDGATASSWPEPPVTITLRHSTVGWTPLDEWSARRRALYLTTHDTRNRQTDRHPCPRWDSDPQYHAL